MVAAVVVVVVVADAAVVVGSQSMTELKTESRTEIWTESRTESRTEIRTAIGLGYRSELALYIERREDLGFVEILAEDYHSPSCVPDALKTLAQRGVEIIIHCTSLNLGGTEPVDLKMVKHIDALARYFDSPFVSDHVAFVRAGGLESGHLLPVPRNQVALDLLTRNVAQANEYLSVPLVLENIATTFEWPASMQQMDEADFLTELLRRTDCKFLLDVSNLFANSFNHKFDAVDYLKRLPLERLAYVHMAGGTFKQGLYHDTHCHPLREHSLDLLASLCQLTVPPRVMLERDDSFPPIAELTAELDAIAALCAAAKVDLGMRLKDDKAGGAKDDCTEAEAEIEGQAVDSNAELHLGERGSDLVSSDSDLASMEAAQQAMLRALIIDVASEESNLSGIKPELLEQAHQSLIRKRLRTMRRSCPYLVELFGDEAALDQALRDFYQVMPSPSVSGPYIDAMHFVMYLHGHKDQYPAANKITKSDLSTARAAVDNKTAKGSKTAKESNAAKDCKTAKDSKTGHDGDSKLDYFYRALRKVRLMR